MRDRFWELPLPSLSTEEWEALCDGCGQCCRHKVEDEDSGRVWPTNVDCKLLDLKSGLCSDYKHRRAYVAECVRLTASNVEDIAWLPRTCAYRLREAGLPLPDWHYLVCGDREEIHRRGMSTRGWTISEVDAGDLEHHIVEKWPGSDA